MYSLWRHLPSIVWKRRPIQLTYFVTRRCNAHCPYCFYLESEGQAADGEELSLPEIQSVAASLGKLLWLAFSGGEIFLRKDLAEISRVFYTHNQPAIMLYPTNGMQPTHIRQTIERILTDCPNSRIVVKLSIDGLGIQHDQLRNTPGSFKKTLQTYAQLNPLLERYKNFELGINTVFSSANQNYMDSIIDFVAGMQQAPVHTISMIRGKLRQGLFKDIDPGLYDHAIARLKHNMKNRTSSRYRFSGAGLKAAQDNLQRKLIHRTLLEHKRLIPCYAGRVNLVLGETGEVYPCEMLSQSYGNVRDHHYNLGQVLETAQARQGLAAIKSDACYCTHECYMMTNTLLNPRLYPRLVKEYPGFH